MKKGFIQTNVSIPEDGDTVWFPRHTFVIELNPEQTIVTFDNRDWAILDFWLNFQFMDDVWVLRTNFDARRFTK